MVDPLAAPFAALSAGAAVVSGWLASFAWRRRSRPGATAFAGLMVAVAGWSVVSAVNLVVVHPPTYGVRSAARWFVSGLVPVFGLTFALAYTGRNDLVTPWSVAALASVPAASALVILLGDPGGLWLGSCVAPPPSGVGVVSPSGCRHGPLFFAHMTYAYTLVSMLLGIMLKTTRDSGTTYSAQAAAFVGGALVAFLANVAWLFGVGPFGGIDPTPAAFTVMGVAWTYGVFHSRFLEVVPATSRIGRRTAIADLNDGVAILDDRDRVIRMNDAAGEMFGVDPGGVVGDPVTAVVGDEEFDVRPGEETVEFELDEGRRTFEVTVSPLFDHQDQQIGHTLVFRDVTERLQRKQQLEALNRVLRHNLRNDLNVVKGYADTLAERTTEPETGMAEFIAEQSADLVEVGSKVRDVERIMERRRSQFQRFDLRELLRNVVDDVRTDYPESRVVMHLPTDVWVRSDDLIVETIVENLVDNALEHNDADDPEVEVSATVGESDWVEITIEDNGPGIPEQERAALREGRETDLQHGSGLGLWVVNWGITTLGGDLAIEDADGDDGGTVVRVRLPGLTDPPENESTEGVPPGIGAEAD